MCLLGYDNMWTGDPRFFVIQMWFPGLSVIPAEDNHIFRKLDAYVHQDQPRLFGLEGSAAFSTKHSTITVH